MNNVYLNCQDFFYQIFSPHNYTKLSHTEDNDHVTIRIYAFFCLRLYNKQNITRWLEGYDFYLLVLKTIFYSLADKKSCLTPPCNILYI
jgi:hypothetical protein